MANIRIHLMQKRGDGYVEVKKLKVNENVASFSWKDKTYVVKIEHSMPIRKSLGRVSPELWYDTDNPEPMAFNPKISSTTPKDLQAFMKSQSLQKIVSGDRERFLLYIIVAMGICVAITGVAGIWFFNQTNNKLLDILNQTRMR